LTVIGTGQFIEALIYPLGAATQINYEAFSEDVGPVKGMLGWV